MGGFANEGFVGRNTNDLSIQPMMTHESEQHLVAIIDLCQVAMLSAGADLRIRVWNRAAEALFGYSREEAMGRELADLCADDFRNVCRAGIESLLARKEAAPVAQTLATRGRHRDGREIPIEVAIGAGWFDDEPLLTVAIRDVTDQRRVLDRLNDALQRLQFHVDRMPLAYIVWDADFRVVEWNPAAERIFGYTKDEALLKHAYELIVPPDVTPKVQDVWEKLLQGDTSSHSINENVRKDGSRFTCEWINTPLQTSDGRITGVASMAMDVTERQAIEERIRDSQRLESLGVMAAGIAHDFNSSLMVILGNASLLRSMRDLPSGALVHLELIEEAGSRANELIKQLLTYARTGRYNPQPTDINALIREALAFVQTSVGKRHKIELNLADSLPPILADRSQVEQILINLCINARQAMTDSGVIGIRTAHRDLSPKETMRCLPHGIKPRRYVELTVSDVGCGMDQAVVPRIFDPFYTTKPQGHGLGLAAVLGILRRHGAAVMVDTKPGRGTSFHILFPPCVSEGDSAGNPAQGQQNGHEPCSPPARRLRKRVP